MLRDNRGCSGCSARAGEAIPGREMPLPALSERTRRCRSRGHGGAASPGNGTRRPGRTIRPAERGERLIQREPNPRSARSLPPLRAVVAARRKGRGAGAMAAAGRPLALLTSCAAGFAPEELVKREWGPPAERAGRRGTAV